MPSSLKKRSSAERNYDIGNGELLAVKVALEGWRHWLEGAEQPFLVWADHRNLEYLQTAKHLNSHLDRKDLFLTASTFTCLSDLVPRTQRPMLCPDFTALNLLQGILTTSFPIPAL